MFFATGLYPSLDHLKIFQAPQAKNLTNFHLFHIFFIKENIQSAQIFACGASGNITFQLCKDLKIMKNFPCGAKKMYYSALFSVFETSVVPTNEKQIQKRF